MKTLEKKKVDICICAKNRESLIDAVLKNLNEQTLKDFNIVMCDGRSADSTTKKMIDFQSNKPNVLLVQTDANGKYIDAHNLALSNTVSEYVCWIDSDDVITNDKLEKQAKFLDEHPEVDVVTTGTMLRLGDLQAVMPNSLVEFSNEDIKEAIDKGTLLSDICHFQTAMFRRSCLEKFTCKKYFYDEYEEGRCGEGFLLTLFYLGCTFANIGDVTYSHNLLVGGMTSKTDGKPIFADEINSKTPGRRKQAIMKLFNKYNK